MNGRLKSIETQSAAGIATALNALLNAHQTGVLTINESLPCQQQAEIKRELAGMRFDLEVYVGLAAAVPGEGSHHFLTQVTTSRAVRA